MQTSLVPEESLNLAKALLLQQIPLSESNVESIAEGLISLAANELPLNEPAQAARVYAKLTPQQVQSAFAKWIRPHDLVQVTEGGNPPGPVATKRALARFVRKNWPENLAKSISR